MGNDSEPRETVSRDPPVRGPATLDDDSTRQEGTANRPTLPPGTLVGRYVILECVGAGGMGVVYSAHDPELDRRIALKLLHRDSRKGSRASAGQRRLVREAQAMAKLTHPNVVAVHDVGTHDGAVFLAMEYVEGQTLTEWIALERRPWARVVQILEEAARGLSAAHEAGLVHRDFKPDNVMLAADGRVRVMDFGLARPAGLSDDSTHSSLHSSSGVSGNVRITRTGAAIGTPAYMAPEQHRRQPSGAAGDQFSFCVTLFECLYGVRPFPGDTLESIGERVLAGKIETPTDTRGAPAWLQQVVHRGLAVSPLDRYPSMAALLDDLGRHRKRKRLLRRITMGLGAAWVVVAVGAGMWAWQEHAAAKLQQEREVTATARLEALDARLAELDAAGRSDEAREAFEAFVSSEEHQGTHAIAQAWLRRADRARRGGDRPSELAALASAYATARDRAQRRSALTGIGAAFGRSWDWNGVTAVLGRIAAQDAGDDLQITRLRTDLLLASRDIRGALEVGRETALAEVAPVLEQLAVAHPTPHTADQVRMADVDGDGTSELLLLRADGATVDVVEARPALPIRVTWELPASLGPARLVFPVMLGHGDSNLLAWHPDAPGGPRAVLYAVEADAPRPTFEWDENKLNDVAILDADGDGASEVYVAVGPYARRLYQLVHADDGTWALRSPHPATDRVASDLVALAGVDLDGDGRRELAAAVGPWTAYDVRVYTGTPGGLALTSRRKLGYVASVADLSGEGKLVVAKGDLFPSRQAFPMDAPYGEAAGMYALRPDGGTLAVDAFVPAPVREGGSTPAPGRLWSGDMDGDGRGDVVVTWSEGEVEVTAIYRQRPGGSFAEGRLHGMRVLALADLDDDPNQELIVRLQDGPVWVLGAGRQQLPPVEVDGPGTDPGPPPPGISGELAETWQRAEELVSMGLRDAGVRELERVALLAADGPVAPLALARAASLLEAADELDRAAALYSSAIAEGDTRPETLAAAARTLLAVHSFDEARVFNDQLLARGGLSAGLTAEARERNELLTRVAGAPVHTEVSFGDSLARAWEIAAPGLVRRDVRAGELVIDGFPGSGDLAVLPLERQGGRIGLRVRGRVDRNEWASGIVVGLRDAGGTEIGPGVEIMGWGGGRIFERQIGCRIPDEAILGDRVPSAGPDEDEVFDVSIHLVPELNEVVCRIGGEHAVTRRVKVPGLPSTGRTELVIGAGGEKAVGEPMWTRVHVASITLEGLVIDGSGTADAMAAAARTYVDGDAVGALERAEPFAPSLWGAILLEDLGQRDAARAMLKEVQAGMDQDAVRSRLWPIVRLADQTHGSLLREALGSSYLPTYHGAWSTAAEMHSDDPRVGQSLTTSLAGLETVEPAELGPMGTIVLVSLHLARGRSWWLQGRYGAARVDLERAVTLGGARPPEELQRPLAEAHRLLAAIDAGAGQRDAAMGHVGVSLELSPSPEIGRDALARMPELRGLRGTASWDEAVRP